MQDGVERMSVVNPTDIKVHGLDCQRVVDASLMPYVTNGEMYAPVMPRIGRRCDVVARARH